MMEIHAPAAENVSITLQYSQQNEKHAKSNPEPLFSNISPESPVSYTHLTLPTKRIV